MKRFIIFIFVFFSIHSGLMSQDRKMLDSLKTRYDKVQYLERDGVTEAYTVFRSGKVGVCNAQGQEVCPPKYDDVAFYGKAHPLSYSFRIDGKKGVGTMDGSVIIAAEYDEINFWSYDSGLLLYNVIKNRKHGICQPDGKLVVAPQYDLISNVGFDEPYFNAESGDKKGLIGPDFSIVVPVKYDELFCFRTVSGTVITKTRVGNKWGIYDHSGREVYPPVFDDVEFDQEIVCKRDGKVGVLDLNIHTLLPVEYDSVKMTTDYKFIRAYSKGRSGFFRHSDGKEIISRDAYMWKSYNKNKKHFIVWADTARATRKVGYCDTLGKVVVPAIYKNFATNGPYIYVYSESVKQKYPDGVLSLDGKPIVATGRYKCVASNQEFYPYIIVSNNPESVVPMGLCDSTGKEIIPVKYESLRRTVDDESNTFFAVCVKSGSNPDRYSWGAADANGRIVVEPIYSIIGTGVREKLFPCSKNGKFGFVSAENGRVIVDFQYDSIGPFFNGVAKVYKDGKMSLLNNPLRNASMNTSQTIAKDRAVSTFPAADSDVDRDIPKGSKADANTYAFIIANENYPAAKVPYALNDGWTFEKYCKQTLGIKDENVHLFEDATGGNIMACVEQMKQAAKTSDGKATIIFYYAGHAFPDEASKSGYLLPIDGDSKNTATGYSLEKLYKELNSISAKQIVCFIDACFSGATREDNMLIAGRGVAIKVNDEVPQGNTVVVTSATGAETAHSYEEMHHGLFTYYLLEKLQQTKGNVTLGELSEYVTKMVKRKSVLINQKKQTPTVIPSPKLQTSWQNLKL